MAGKERESQLSSQFRDIATIVMQKTYNPETRRPYTISLIESLMHEIHFAVDPHKSSKKQVIESLFPFMLHTNILVWSSLDACIPDRCGFWHFRLIFK